MTFMPLIKIYLSCIFLHNNQAFLLIKKYGTYHYAPYFLRKILSEKRFNENYCSDDSIESLQDNFSLGCLGFDKSMSLAQVFCVYFPKMLAKSSFN
ncbi:hypothetical protein Misp06_01981 [Microbulbifer sp. NBRC 101763]